MRTILYAGGKIERREAGFLVELHKRVPGFEQFFYQALKDRLLADGRLSANDTA